MKISRSIRHVLHLAILCLVISVSGSQPVSYALDAPSTSTGISTAGTTAQNIWNQGQMNFVNVMSSCNNTALKFQQMFNVGGMGSLSAMSLGSKQMLSNLVCSGMGVGNAIGPTSTCPQANTPPSSFINGSPDMLCRSLGQGGKGRIEGLMMQYKAAICAEQCQKGVDLAKTQELQCIMTQSNALNSQMEGMQSVIRANIDAMAKALNEYKNREEGDKQQIEQLTTYLGTFDQLQKNETENIAKLRLEIAQLKNQKKAIDQGWRVLKERLKKEEMANTMDCFQNKTLGAVQTCGPLGEVKSAADKVVCAFSQGRQVNNGTYIRNGIVTAQAEADANNLRKTLSDMAGAAPSVTSGTDGSISPGDAAGASKLQNQSRQVQSIADVETIFGAALSRYGVHDQVMQSLAYCNGLAHSQVSREEEDADSGAGMKKMEQEQSQESLDQTINSDITSAAGRFADAASQLNINPNITDLSRCTSGTTDQKIACLSGITESEQKLVTGGPGVPVAQLPVNGNDPSQNRILKGSGIAELKRNGLAMQREEQASLNNLVKGQKTLVTNFQQGVKNFVQNMANQVKPQMMQIRQRLAQMGIVAKDVQGESLQFDEDGNLIDPQSVAGLIASKDGAFDLNDLAPKISEIKQDSDQVDQKINENLQSLLVLSQLTQTCMINAMDKLANLATSAQNCQNYPVCKDAPSREKDAIANITGNMQLLGDSAASSLTAGIQSACDGPQMPRRPSSVAPTPPIRSAFTGANAQQDYDTAQADYEQRKANYDAEMADYRQMNMSVGMQTYPRGCATLQAVLLGASAKVDAIKALNNGAAGGASGSAMMGP